MEFVAAAVAIGVGVAGGGEEAAVVAGEDLPGA